MEEKINIVLELFDTGSIYYFKNKALRHKLPTALLHATRFLADKALPEKRLTKTRSLDFNPVKTRVHMIHLKCVL